MASIIGKYYLKVMYSVYSHDTIIDTNNISLICNVKYGKKLDGQKKKIK